MTTAELSLEAQIVRSNLLVTDQKLISLIEDAEGERKTRLRRARVQFHNAARDVLEALGE